MVKDRFLMGILVGISALIIAALVLFFVRQTNSDYVDDARPESVLRNYILALQRGDYDRAYASLAQIRERPSLERFRQTFENYPSGEIANTAVEIQPYDGSGLESQISLPVTLLRGGGGPFNDIYRSQEQATLVRENGVWKISLAPYPFWGYNWQYEFELDSTLTPGP